MFCVNCGKSLSNDFNFCPYCGTNIISGVMPNNLSNSNSGFDIRDGVLVKYTGRASHVVVPDGVKIVGKYAFSEEGYEHRYKYNEYVKKITLPDSVIEIESYAFNNCSCLTEIQLSQGLTEIQPYTFYGCEKLDTVHIPSSVKVIQRDAFICKLNYARSCPLEKTVIPESVIEMGRSRHATSAGVDNDYVNTFYGGLCSTKCKLNSKYQEIYSWKRLGLCEYCGGKISFFSSKCKTCGKTRD